MPINLGNYISVCKNEKIFCWIRWIDASSHSKNRKFDYFLKRKIRILKIIEFN